MAPTRFTTRPIYLQLRDVLSERISTGVWKPGMVLPNETDLAREFGVSPGTMRKALSIMESEHLLKRQQGRGTFINDHASGELADRFCNVRRAEGKPVAGRFEVIHIVEATANAAERKHLQLGSDDVVWRIRRVRIHEDEAFMYEEVSLPAELFPGLGADASNRIAVLAQQHGLLLGPAEERISIGAASESAASALDIEQGAPVLMLDRVVRTIGGQPVEWRVGQCDLASNYYLAQVS
jgi:GntR family transcriptional regulator